MHVCIHLYTLLYACTARQWFTPIWFLSHLWSLSPPLYLYIHIKRKCIYLYLVAAAAAADAVQSSLSSSPLHPAGFNNKTTDCVIKTTSINHTRVPVGWPKKIFSHRRIHCERPIAWFIRAALIIGFPNTLWSRSVANWDVFVCAVCVVRAHYTIHTRRGRSCYTLYARVLIFIYIYNMCI